jgi:LysR family transcriptional regulator (chromosome initiation inhibitor)
MQKPRIPITVEYSSPARTGGADRVSTGAVTTERTPVPGCPVQSLGVMRYVPVESAPYVERYLPDGFRAEGAATAPSLAWNRDNALQDMLVRKAFRHTVARPVHYVPTAEGSATQCGPNWARASTCINPPPARPC